LIFAREYISWGPEEWRRCGFTDEMGMQTGANSKKVYVWRSPDEEYLEDACAATVIPGFQKVKVWGAMRYGKLSELVVLPEKEGQGKLNAVEYREIIMDGEMLTFWMEGMEDVGYLLMMEDGAPYHKGAASDRRKELEKVGWIGWGPGTWPSNSPDLNPIENLWHILRSNIRKRKRQPRNKKELIDALQEEWKKLDIQIVNNLIDSMPRRMQAVLDAEGGPTHY
jgi:transposase